MDLTATPPEAEWGAECIPVRVIYDQQGDYFVTQFGFYAEPASKTALPSAFIAFYANDAIAYVYQIVHTKTATVNQNAELEYLSYWGKIQSDVPYRLYYLQNYHTLAPVVNDLLRENKQRKLPFTVSQRYTYLSDLLSSDYTSQLRTVEYAKKKPTIDYSYIDTLRTKNLPVADNEQARIMELRELNILDTEREPEFDNLTRLASYVCQSPIAIISLVDSERQWFKSEVGLGATETSREVSFCQYTVMQDQIFEVSDATTDERFQDNPYVLGNPHIRFYAGAPLKTESGHNIGSLCVLNSKVHELTDYQREILQTLANEAVMKIELRRKNQQLEELHQAQRLILEDLQEAQNRLAEFHQSMTESITYAGRIQENFLPHEQLFKDNFSEYFIYYAPRDIVGGDFYTINRIHNKIFIAVADCTGHGVPGAFMTLIAINTLNKLIDEQGLVEPSAILQALDQDISKALNQHEESVYNRDGLDIALCVLDTEEQTLTIASGQRPVWLFQNGLMVEMEGDRFAVAGGFHQGKKEFTSVTKKIQSGDVLYLFTDGITDQFGGNDERPSRYSVRRLRDLVYQISNMSLEEQKNGFLERFLGWQGKTPQLDDQLMIAIQL